MSGFAMVRDYERRPFALRQQGVHERLVSVRMHHFGALRFQRCAKLQNCTEIEAATDMESANRDALHMRRLNEALAVVGTALVHDH